MTKITMTVSSGISEGANFKITKVMPINTMLLSRILAYIFKLPRSKTVVEYMTVVSVDSETTMTVKKLGED